MTEFTHIRHKCELYASGNVKSVCVEINGKRDGQYIHYYTNGNKSIIINYNNGLRNGKCIEYYTNGEIKSISNYINDKKEKEDDDDINDESMIQNYCVIC